MGRYDKGFLLKNEDGRRRGKDVQPQWARETLLDNAAVDQFKS